MKDMILIYKCAAGSRRQAAEKRRAESKGGQEGSRFLFVPFSRPCDRAAVFLAATPATPRLRALWAIFIVRRTDGGKEKASWWRFVHNYMEIGGTVTHTADAISCAGPNPRQSRGTGGV